MRFIWLTAALVGCPWVGGDKYVERVQDLDGDGSISTRFNGPDCLDDNPEITDCDADNDGHLITEAGGDDCDDNNASVYPGAPETCELDDSRNPIDHDCDGVAGNADPDVVSDNTFYVDDDQDGDGDPDQPRACQEYFGQSTNPRFVTNDRDCDDDDPLIGTSATEVCDGIDNNCDGVVDDVGLWYVDDDGDGFGRPGSQTVGPCDLGNTADLASNDLDCDDTDAAAYPNAAEIPYDQIDQNCNGNQDNWDADLDGYIPSQYWAAAQAYNQTLPVDEQFDWSEGDCDDEDPRRNNGEAEVCDGVDNDCDGRIDIEDLENILPTDEPALRAQVQQVYFDADGDGYFGVRVLLCPDDVDPEIHSVTADDCFEGDDPAYGSIDPALVNQGAEERCDGVDNDCNGRIDWANSSFPSAGVYYIDGDGDGVGSAEVYACNARPEAGIVSVGDDCNDGDDQTYPGATEICGDAVRQDCHPTASQWDCDADGQEGSYGINGSGQDCDDGNAQVYETDAAAFERCDGIDNDCDGLIDSADQDNLDTETEVRWYPDLDEDGWGDPSEPGLQQCDAPSAFSAPRAGDCDDNDPLNNPDIPWYRDADADGFGDPTTRTVSGCQPPDDGFAWVRDARDCNDQNDAYTPNTLWYADEDGDFVGNPTVTATFCSPPAGEGWVLASDTHDCDDSDPAVTGTSTWYRDVDSDRWGDPDVTAEACAAPVIDGFRYVLDAGDCNDNDATVSPDRVESCNGVDDDCDGLADDQDPNVVAGPGGPVGHQDLDGDGFGLDTVTKSFCAALPPGWAPASGDCDDTNADVFPGQVEICGNGLDDDCSGDEQTPVWYVDADGDGFGIGAPSAPACEPPVGYSATVGGDCDDTQALSFPGAIERDACDTIDDDCDGVPEPRLTWYFDADGDTYGDDAYQETTCVPPSASPVQGVTGTWVLDGGDCDDTDPSVTFGRLWYVDADGDGLGNDTAAFFDCPVFDEFGTQQSSFLLDDLNGNGAYDPGDRAASIFAGDCDDQNALVGLARGYRVDADGDGWGSSNLPQTIACPDASGNPPPGLVSRTGDCVDVPSDDPDTLVPPDQINPEQVEILDDLADNDCDGFTDQIGGGIAWFEDLDGDGLGGAALSGYAPGAVTNGTDCDDEDASISNGRYAFVDGDADGYGAGSAVFLAGQCTVPSGYSAFGGDCDDGSTAFAPGAIEVCDGLDQNCNGVIDEGQDEAGYLDRDGDGFGDENAPGRFCPGASYVTDVSEPDCNDRDALVNPDAVEICDGVDNNCVGGIGDEARSLWYLDGDGDTYGSNLAVIQACDAPGPEWITQGGDCDDSDGAVLPGGTEVCNGLDDDCNGTADDGLASFNAYRDADGDGAVESTTPIQVCQLPVGYIPAVGPVDCNDTDDRQSPTLPEICGDGLDNDCSGTADDQSLRYVDADSDGFGWAFTPRELAACNSTGHADSAGDCNDSLATVNPGQTDDSCDGLDNDCNNLIDDAVPVGDLSTFWRDLDNDGYGDASRAINTCVAPVGYTNDNTDCNDLVATVNPGATEVCNGVDDDCDGSIEVTQTYYADLDQDGAVDINRTWQVCGGDTPPPFFDTTDNSVVDCNDRNALQAPGNQELCGDGIDNDCDGSIDDQGPVYTDVDGDGYGVGSVFIGSCTTNALVDGDCADNTGEGGINPGVLTDLCDGLDNDCDGDTDEDAVVALTYVDADGDGFGNPYLPLEDCLGVQGGVIDNTDCDDQNAAVNGLAFEVCNGIDDNCDGLLLPTEVDNDLDGYLACQESNDADPGDVPGALVWYQDVDGDGYGDTSTATLSLLSPGAGWTLQDGDCNDADASMSPGFSIELCDGKDNNCDGAGLYDGSTLITRDISNPYTNTPVSQPIGAMAHDVDLDGIFSIDSIRTCTQYGGFASAELRIPGESTIPLFDIVVDSVEELFDTYTDCVFGNPITAYYAGDPDGDGVAGPWGVEDVYVDCGAGNPGPPWELYISGVTVLDCAENDSSRSVRVQAGEYGDADGDGWPSIRSDVGQCVAWTTTSPGNDCDDYNASVYDQFVGTQWIYDQATFDLYWANCGGSYVIDTPGLSFPAFYSPYGKDMEVTSTFAGTCDGIQTSSCIGGTAYVSQQGSLRLFDIDLSGGVVASFADVSLESVGGADFTVDVQNANLELYSVNPYLTDAATSPLFRVSNGTLSSAFMTVQNPTTPSGTVYELSNTDANLSDHTLFDVDTAVRASNNSTVDLVQFNLINLAFPFDVSNLASVWVDQGYFETSGNSTIADGELECNDCYQVAPTTTQWTVRGADGVFRWIGGGLDAVGVGDSWLWVEQDGVAEVDGLEVFTDFGGSVATVQTGGFADVRNVTLPEVAPQPLFFVNNAAADIADVQVSSAGGDLFLAGSSATVSMSGINAVGPSMMQVDASTVDVTDSHFESRDPVYMVLASNSQVDLERVRGFLMPGTTKDYVVRGQNGSSVSMYGSNLGAPFETTMNSDAFIMANNSSLLMDRSTAHLPSFGGQGGNLFNALDGSSAIVARDSQLRFDPNIGCFFITNGASPGSMVLRDSWVEDTLAIFEVAGPCLTPTLIGGLETPFGTGSAFSDALFYEQNPQIRLVYGESSY